MFSKDVVEQYVEKKPSYNKGKISAFATGNEENWDVCIYCNERYKLESCIRFMDKTLRIKFLPKQKSCYGCLKPMTESHNAKTCTQWLACSNCKRNHPTPLHGHIPNKKSKTNGNQTVDGGGNLKNNFVGFNNDLKCVSMTGKTGSKVISMSIVPVKSMEWKPLWTLRHYMVKKTEHSMVIEGIKVTGMSGDGSVLTLTSWQRRNCNSS